MPGTVLNAFHAFCHSVLTTALEEGRCHYCPYLTDEGTKPAMSASRACSLTMISSCPLKMNMQKCAPTPQKSQGGWPQIYQVHGSPFSHTSSSKSFAKHAWRGNSLPNVLKPHNHPPLFREEIISSTQSLLIFIGMFSSLEIKYE